MKGIGITGCLIVTTRPLTINDIVAEAQRQLLGKQTAEQVKAETAHYKRTGLYPTRIAKVAPKGFIRAAAILYAAGARV